MAWIDDILDQYFSDRLFDRYDYYIEGPDAIGNSVIHLVNFMENNDHDYYDTTALKQYYLTELPKNGIIFPEEALPVHDALLDFYQLLQQTKHIETKDYKNILQFFQENKAVFLQRMDEESFWSKDKKKQLDQLDKEALDSLPPELDDLFKGLSHMIGQTPAAKNTKAKNNIINFPGAGQSLDEKEYALQLRIDLVGFKPPIWRRVLVSSKATLADLHQVIQICFDWEDAHLHDFEVNNQVFSPEEEEVDGFWDDFSVDERSVTLGEVFDGAMTIHYTYDFGDDWYHKIKCEKKLSLDASLTAAQLPQCIKGKQATPAEDSRGSEEYDEDFDQEKINLQLKDL